MRAGGHYRFGLPEDAVDRWEAVFREFWGWCQARFPVIISCHDRSELRSAKRLVPRAQKFYSPNAREYLELYSKARFYVGSRVHAAMAVASFGRPAHVIGNDTRSEMVDTVGLERTFAQSITVEKLQAICVQLEERSLSYAQYMSDLRRSVQNDYRTLIAGVLNSSQLRVSQL
jgi:hypothetical protein